MSQKKKLVLGPLPEQADDYSQYEETVTHWDRIIAVLLVIALVFGLVIYALTGDDNEHGQVENIQPEPKLSIPAADQIVGKAEESNIDLNKNDIDKNETIETGADIPVSDSPATPKLDIQGELSSAVPANTVPSDTLEEDTVLLPKNKQQTSEKALSRPKLAVVSIVNNAISRAVLTQEIKDKEPGSTLPYELILPEAGIVKVILFTEMEGLRGKKLYHEWYRNGIRQARVKIPVNVNKQRSYSSKYINAQMLGDWQVKVLDEMSESYVLADFSVVNP